MAKQQLEADKGENENLEIRQDSVLDTEGDKIRKNFTKIIK